MSNEYEIHDEYPCRFGSAGEKTRCKTGETNHKEK